MTPAAKPRLPRVVSAEKIRAARGALPAPEVLAEGAEVFRLLASPVRLALMQRIIMTS